MITLRYVINLFSSATTENTLRFTTLPIMAAVSVSNDDWEAISRVDTGPTADTFFRDAHCQMSAAAHTPVAIFPVSNGDVLSVAVRRKVDPSELKRQTRAIYHTHGGGLHCNTCNDFFKNFAHLEFAGGMMFASTSGPYAVLGQKGRGSFDMFEILTGEIGVPEAGGFVHFSTTPTEVSQFKNSFRTVDYDWYLKQNLTTLMRLLSRHAEDGILESLELLIATLGDVTYGDKLVHAMRWFLAAMQDYLAIPADAPDYAKHVVAARALLTARLAPGVGHERIICTNLGQAKDNGLDALACARDVPALTKLLDARFSPTTYCRPTAAATTGQLTEAMKLFADLGFTTELMTINAIVKYGGVLVPTSSSGGGKDATAIWGASLAKHKSKASGFAARSGGASTAFPVTFKELMARIAEFPGLEVQTTGQTPVCLTEIPESAQVALKYSHLWGFQNGKQLSIYGIHNTWCSVNAISEMGRNVFIGLAGARPAPKMGNTCFPSFLATAYERRCRSAFEELNKTDMVVTGSGPFALGTGTSRVGESGKSYSPIRFRFQGREFAIGKF